ncbi:MarR family winged helix-turn-helix transcriptional regulator [Leptospira kmetyi]|uniref:MarR family transcriptional regulator n=1 Tax=Leptospira kmetyi TaxID=408139 RepID=A0A2M9XQF9_9LEPT|nr:MarR family winged helix-turn-helix transcriptional regulator [Leptospira kmetyi]AYV55612.1 MarR family transcriptional regulator [Leptospira kmetyi]EQA53229.1 sugar-specific transcriptional regulator, TrmB family [Leptospira kmetyi serovar Malaysia str. Bejo-Iso9]PJZ27991.1 MarR family transcriptional regulator [Leptospira kmetyi]PJZ41423.1 MarR family transcriptional regulator [Leptospira kmetyi]TGL66740.1 MarR family transcriptional regulator [Leptospira kmetyi]
MKLSNQNLKVIGLSCLNVSLRRTARKITSYYDFILKPAGLRITQFTILVSVAHEEECSITDLSKLTDIDRTTLQRSLEILKRDGLVKIEKKESGNVRSVFLTKKGESKLEEAAELWKQAQSSITDSLGKTKFKETLSILSDVRKLPILQNDFEESL